MYSCWDFFVPSLLLSGLATTIFHRHPGNPSLSRGGEVLPRKSDSLGRPIFEKRMPGICLRRCPPIEKTRMLIALRMDQVDGYAGSQLYKLSVYPVVPYG